MKLLITRIKRRRKANETTSKEVKKSKNQSLVSNKKDKLSVLNCVGLVGPLKVIVLTFCCFFYTKRYYSTMLDISEVGDLDFSWFIRATKIHFDIFE